MHLLLQLTNVNNENRKKNVIIAPLFNIKLSMIYFDLHTTGSIILTLQPVLKIQVIISTHIT